MIPNIPVQWRMHELGGAILVICLPHKICVIKWKFFFMLYICWDELCNVSSYWFKQAMDFSLWLRQCFKPSNLILANFLKRWEIHAEQKQTLDKTTNNLLMRKSKNCSHQMHEVQLQSIIFSLESCGCVADFSAAKILIKTNGSGPWLPSTNWVKQHMCTYKYKHPNRVFD